MSAKEHLSDIKEYTGLVAWMVDWDHDHIEIGVNFTSDLES